MNEDSTLERIWETRRRIFAKCENDPAKLVQYYMERQQENAERLVYQPASKVVPPSSDSVRMAK
jgi:hypothetical protein